MYIFFYVQSLSRISGRLISVKYASAVTLFEWRGYKPTHMHPPPPQTWRTRLFGYVWRPSFHLSHWHSLWDLQCWRTSYSRKRGKTTEVDACICNKLETQPVKCKIHNERFENVCTPLEYTRTFRLSPFSRKGREHENQQIALRITNGIYSVLIVKFVFAIDQGYLPVNRDWCL
jgi:hypothetical protein